MKQKQGRICRRFLEFPIASDRVVVWRTFMAWWWNLVLAPNLRLTKTRANPRRVAPILEAGTNSNAESAGSRLVGGATPKVVGPLRRTASSSPIGHSVGPELSRRFR